MSASRPHHPDTLAAGQRIGPFVLLAPLGSGGSGRIWAVARVGQLGFTKRMVLKVMRHDKLSSERARARFDREACLGGRLSHPNVRAVHDLGSHEGRPFMALSWVDASLEELLEHAPGHVLDADVACWIGMQCCSALSAAHEYVDNGGVARPIVHRDVSPGNILLTADGHALLADLTAPAAEGSPPPEPGAGAKAAARGEPKGRFFGSLGYAAPEALRQDPCDARADLFSLGAVLFEALAGAPAFGGDDERTVMFQILEGPPLDLAQRAPGVPAGLAAVVQRCLERRAENRFQSARELRAALSHCAGQRSAFRLEQHTAGIVREVLGARIRAREEALHLAYQHVAPSQFEHTDTLPIPFGGGPGGGERASDSSPSEVGPDVSHSGAAMALSRPRARRRRRTLWAAGGLAVVLGLYGSLANRWRPVQSTQPDVAADEAAARAQDPPSSSAAPLLPLKAADPPRVPAPELPPSTIEPPSRRPASDAPPPAAAPAPASPRRRSPSSTGGARDDAVIPNRTRDPSGPPAQSSETAGDGDGALRPSPRAPMDLDRRSPYARRKHSTAAEGAGPASAP